MAIIKQLPCPQCRTLTYQRYDDCLRLRYTSRTYWLCMTCKTKTYTDDGQVEICRPARPRPVIDEAEAS